MELLNAIRTILKEYNLPIYINSTQTFKRNSFYVRIEDSQINDLNDQIENRNCRITVRYFAKMDNYNVVDAIDVLNMEKQLNKSFNKVIGDYRILSKNFEKDANGDLVLTVYINTNTITIYTPNNFVGAIEYNVTINNDLGGKN